MGRRIRYSTVLLVGPAVALTLALAACGATSSASGAAGSSGGLYGSSNTPAPTATSATSGSGSAMVATGTATVAGKSETILTNAQGMTLYYFTPDTAQKVACTSSCTGIWPPLLASSGGPTARGSLPGTLGVLDGANGKQVTYNGHPLYTFVNDKAPGDTNGEGIKGEWFVATPSLAAASGGGAPPQATPTTGGYGYGG